MYALLSVSVQFMGDNLQLDPRDNGTVETEGWGGPLNKDMHPWANFHPSLAALTPIV